MDDGRRRRERRERGNAEPPAVQDAWPELTCYGCGPGNPHGLQLKSHLSDDGTALDATFDPRPDFNAGVPNVMYGGLIASLVDCNSVWTAMTFRSLADGRSVRDGPAVRYVTGRLTVDYLKPTPLDRSVHLRSRVAGDVGRKIRVSTELRSGGETTARGDVTAVAI